MRQRLLTLFKKHNRLFIGVAILLALVIYTVLDIAFEERPSNAVAAQRSAVSEPPPEVATEVPPVPENGITDIFGVRTWQPPPPPPPKPLPPPPPQAPPLPFKLIGQINEASGRAFLLSYGEQVLSVRAGTDIDETYRLDKFEGGQLYFLYRPLNSYQTLFVGTQL